MRIPSTLAVTAAAALLAACYSPDLGNGELACGPDRTCPSGYVCRMDRCWAEAPGDDGGDGPGDAGPDGDPGAVPLDQIVVSGGGGPAAGTRHRAIIVIGQPVAAPPATSGGRAAAFGIVTTSTTP